jgi:hypothetical protein
MMMLCGYRPVSFVWGPREIEAEEGADDASDDVGRLRDVVLGQPHEELATDEEEGDQDEGEG